MGLNVDYCSVVDPGNKNFIQSLAKANNLFKGINFSAELKLWPTIDRQVTSSKKL